VDNSRRLLIRRSTGVRPLGAQVVPGRERNEKPVSSMNTITACFRLAFLADPGPIVGEPGPDHLLIAFLGSDGGDLGTPTQRPEPSGQVIRVVTDPELASDDVADPFQGPTVGLESRLQGSLAEGPQEAPPLSGVQPRRSPCLGSTPKGPQPGSGMIAQLPGPLLHRPQADTQPLGDLGLGQSSGSEQSSSLEPTFFNLALSQFAWAPHD
jgi:hypothetical protein